MDGLTPRAGHVQVRRATRSEDDGKHRFGREDPVSEEGDRGAEGKPDHDLREGVLRAVRRRES